MNTRARWHGMALSLAGVASFLGWYKQARKCRRNLLLAINRII